VKVLENRVLRRNWILERGGNGGTGENCIMRRFIICTPQ
jgi:hypothetical protein